MDGYLNEMGHMADEARADQDEWKSLRTQSRKKDLSRSTNDSQPLSEYWVKDVFGLSDNETLKDKPELMNQLVKVLANHRPGRDWSNGSQSDSLGNSPSGTKGRHHGTSTRQTMAHAPTWRSSTVQSTGTVDPARGDRTLWEPVEFSRPCCVQERLSWKDSWIIGYIVSAHQPSWYLTMNGPAKPSKSYANHSKWNTYNPVLQPQEQRPDWEDLWDNQTFAQGSDQRTEPDGLGELASTHCVQPQHYSVQDNRDIALPTGSRRIPPNTTDRRVGTAGPRTIGPGRIHVTLSTTMGRLLATAKNKYQVYLRRTADTYTARSPLGLRTTPGNASMVLVTISKWKERWVLSRPSGQDHGG